MRLSDSERSLMLFTVTAVHDRMLKAVQKTEDLSDQDIVVIHEFLRIAGIQVKNCESCGMSLVQGLEFLKKINLAVRKI